MKSIRNGPACKLVSHVKRVSNLLTKESFLWLSLNLSRWSSSLVVSSFIAARSLFNHKNQGWVLTTKGQFVVLSYLNKRAGHDSVTPVFFFDVVITSLFVFYVWLFWVYFGCLWKACKRAWMTVTTCCQDSRDKRKHFSLRHGVRSLTYANDWHVGGF